MKAVAAPRLRQRMQQQRALHGFPRDDEQLPHFKVLAGLFLAPPGSSRRQRFQGRTAVLVTSHATRVPRALLEKNGLNTVSEKGVVQGGRGRRRGRLQSQPRRD